jgi:hypothetical protein
VWSESGFWKFDVLECEYCCELVEVGVAVKKCDAAVLGSGCSDQRVGQWHAVIPSLCSASSPNALIVASVQGFAYSQMGSPCIVV